MAQSRPAPGISNVPDPGGAMWPTNTPMAQPAPARYGPASSPATGGQAIMRQGASWPLNTPMTQPAPQLSGSTPAPAIQAVGGVSTAWNGISSVPDPGGTRLPMGPTSTIGYGGDPGAPEGGDPRAMGSSFSSADADAPTWSQFNPTFNPNPGALSGGSAQIPGLYPGETPANQVSPEANPNPGAL